tara:strand:- start:840 stop:956 length:117 start_codon:yes stop_codon:yes gene_type:complete
MNKINKNSTIEIIEEQQEDEVTFNRFGSLSRESKEQVS